MRDLNIRLSIKLNVLTVAFVKRFVLYSIKHIMYFQIPHMLFVIKILKLYRSSTSGGAVTAFSKEIINNGGIVFGGSI